jgi:hypothetical protein
MGRRVQPRWNDGGTVRGKRDGFGGLTREGGKHRLLAWFAHTPAVAEQNRATARTTAEARYAQFVEYVSSQFSAGRRFLDDVPRDVVADE